MKTNKRTLVVLSTFNHGQPRGDLVPMMFTIKYVPECTHVYMDHSYYLCSMLLCFKRLHSTTKPLNTQYRCGLLSKDLQITKCLNQSHSFIYHRNLVSCQCIQSTLAQH